MEVSWASAEAWDRAAAGEERRGRRATVGPICRTCLRLIPRDEELRFDIADQMCGCGFTTTKRSDEESHGVWLGRMVQVNPWLYE